MKVFLCGGGSGEVSKLATLKFGEVIDKTKPLLYVPLAMKKERYPSCLEWISKEMSLINVENIEMITSGKELSAKNLNDYCAIYIGGGNTYKLLNELKESKAFEKIKKYLANDGIVFGGSAGAIIFGKDIDSCKTQDENNVKLTDTRGFNILSDYSILCHLNRNDGIKFNRNKNSDYLLNFSKKNKIVYLPDDDTIFVTKKSITMIGKSSYRIYEDGRYKTLKVISEKLDLWEEIITKKR